MAVVAETKTTAFIALLTVTSVAIVSLVAVIVKIQYLCRRGLREEEVLKVSLEITRSFGTVLMLEKDATTIVDYKYNGINLVRENCVK